MHTWPFPAHNAAYICTYPSYSLWHLSCPVACMLPTCSHHHFLPTPVYVLSSPGERLYCHTFGLAAPASTGANTCSICPCCKHCPSSPLVTIQQSYSIPSPNLLHFLLFMSCQWGTFMGLAKLCSCMVHVKLAHQKVSTSRSTYTWFGSYALCPALLPHILPLYIWVPPRAELPHILTSFS